MEELKTREEAARLEAEGACMLMIACRVNPLFTTSKAVQYINVCCEHRRQCKRLSRRAAESAHVGVSHFRARRHFLAGKPERAAALLRRTSLGVNERPRLADMQANAALLLAELRRCYGSLGYLPTRKDLREANRRVLAQHPTGQCRCVISSDLCGT